MSSKAKSIFETVPSRAIMNSSIFGSFVFLGDRFSNELKFILVGSDGGQDFQVQKNLIHLFLNLINCQFSTGIL
jgi:hypothetical protein